MDPPQPSYDIPGYAEGYISIQDGGPQQAAYLMQLQPGQRVLDACAAPGGKTAHMLETEPHLQEMVAIDQDKRRVDKIHQYLSRLGLSATVFQANALRPDLWWSGEQFDRILLDIPCTATGVIQRHPDIKLIRLEEEPSQMAEEQLLFLKTLWPLLKPGGILLYATCSLMPEENSQVVSRFMKQNQTAKELPIEAAWGVNQPVGRQILPNGEQNGFYYARLIKTKSNKP
jgi:16S rRNA (cytosine967-C5)-methyltransferase